MNYQEFKETVIRDLPLALPKEYGDIVVREEWVEKMQGRPYEGVSFSDPKTGVGAILPLQNYFRLMEQGLSYEAVREEMVYDAKAAIERMPEWSRDQLLDYNFVKPRLFLQAIRTETNLETLRSVPHMTVGDISVIARMELETKGEEAASAVITARMLSFYGISQEQLFEDAKEMAPQRFPAQIRDLTEVITEMTGVELPQEESGKHLYVASVPSNFLGAGILAYPDFFEQAAAAVEGNFFLFPSSIHELVLMPEGASSMTVSEMRQMIRQINEQSVSPEERLSDRVYHYDRSEKVFEFAETYEARRQRGREGGGPCSLTGSLREKREAIARTDFVRQMPPEIWMPRRE